MQEDELDVVVAEMINLKTQLSLTFELLDNYTSKYDFAGVESVYDDALGVLSTFKRTERGLRRHRTQLLNP